MDRREAATNGRSCSRSANSLRGTPSIPGPAMRLQDFPVSGEGKNDVDGFAFVAEIVEFDPAGGRRDLLELKGVWRVAIEPGSPICFQLAPPPIAFLPFAFAQKTCVLCVQIEKRHEIAAPTGVEPIDDDGHLIEILLKVRRVHLVAPGSGPDRQQRYGDRAVNAH